MNDDTVEVEIIKEHCCTICLKEYAEKIDAIECCWLEKWEADNGAESDRADSLNDENWLEGK
jgi:hypothetical protein